MRRAIHRSFGPLPPEVQKDIEETRTSCRSTDNEINSGDSGLIQFLLGGRKAVLVDISNSAVAATRDTTAPTEVLAS